MASTITTDHTTVHIEPQCIAHKAADLPLKPEAKYVAHKFPWRPIAEAIVQIAIFALAAVVSIRARLKVFIYIFCVLAVPQLLLIVTRFRHVANVTFARDTDESSSEWLSESSSSDILKKPGFAATIIRKAIAEELGSFRSELIRFENLSMEREESRNLSLSQALSVVNESVLALKEEMERRDQMRPSVPYATLQELEGMRTKVSFLERENASIKQQLRAAQLSYEEALRNAAKSRKEAEDAAFRELSAREELAIAQTRLVHMDELTDRLDRSEAKTMQLQEELLTRARERERFKLSADDANRRVARVENIINILREQLRKLSGNSPSDGQDEPVDEDLAESEKKFWQRRLKSRGNLGRDSIVYQELLRGSKESLAKEWPSDPLGRDSSPKEEKNETLEGLPADGGFGSKNFKILESSSDPTETGKILGMSGVPSQGAFSFSRGEFQQKDEGATNGKPRTGDSVAVNDLFPEAEDVPDKASSDGEDGAEVSSEKKIEQSEAHENRNTETQTSERSQTAKDDLKDEQTQIPELNSPRTGRTTDSYMQWLEKASQFESSPISSRRKSDFTSQSQYPNQKDSSASRVPSRSQPNREEPIVIQEKGDLRDIELRAQDLSETESTALKAGESQDTSKAVKNLGDKGQPNQEVDFIDEPQKGDVTERSPVLSEGAEQPSTRLDRLQDTLKPTDPGSSMPFEGSSLEGDGRARQDKVLTVKVANDGEVANKLQEDASAARPQPAMDPGKGIERSEGPNSIARIISSKIADAQELIEKGRSSGISVSKAASFLEEAKGILEECLKLNCLRPEVEAAMGECLVVWAKLDLKDQRARGLIWEALEYLSRSVEAKPNDEKALFNCALCNALYGALSTHDIAVHHQYQAVQQFDKLLKLNPSAQVAAYNGGLAYLYLARSNIASEGKNRSVIERYFRLAIERFAKGVMLNPQDPRNAAYLDTARNEMKNFLEKDDEMASS